MASSLAPFIGANQRSLSPIGSFCLGNTYSSIINRENRAELWPVYLAYDVEIRRRTVQFPIDPSVFSIGIWNDLEARYTAKKVLSMVQTDLGLQAARSSSHSDYSRSRNSNQGPSFRNNNPPPHGSKTGRCIFCGDRTKSHLSRNCACTTNTSGAPCFLYKVNPSEPRQSRSGKRYCFAWNGPSGCDQGSSLCCSRGEHSCTLCGSSSHAAQQCSAVA